MPARASAARHPWTLRGDAGDTRRCLRPCVAHVASTTTRALPPSSPTWSSVHLRVPLIRGDPLGSMRGIRLSILAGEYQEFGVAPPVQPAQLPLPAPARAAHRVHAKPWFGVLAVPLSGMARKSSRCRWVHQRTGLFWVDRVHTMVLRGALGRASGVVKAGLYLVASTDFVSDVQRSALALPEPAPGRASSEPGSGASGSPMPSHGPALGVDPRMASSRRCASLQLNALCKRPPVDLRGERRGAVRSAWPR